MSQNQIMELRNGRRLGFASWGDPDGAPLFYLHGTLSSRLEAALLHAAAVRFGVHIIAVDRPGHGLSSPHRGRSFRSFGDDLAQLANHLGIDRFGIAGWSGGGAHAATAARILGDRVTRLSLIAAQAPDLATREAPNRPLLVRLFEALARRTTLHLRFTAWMLGGLLGWLGERLFDKLSRSPLFCEADRRVLAEVNFRRLLSAAWSEGMRGGTRGAADDVALLLTPWDLLPEDTGCPVDVWCGADDLICPPSYGEWFARRWRKSTLHVLPGRGHLHIGALAERIVGPHAMARPIENLDQPRWLLSTSAS